MYYKYSLSSFIAIIIVSLHGKISVMWVNWNGDTSGSLSYMDDILFYCQANDKKTKYGRKWKWEHW